MHCESRADEVNGSTLAYWAVVAKGPDGAGHRDPTAYWAQLHATAEMTNAGAQAAPAAEVGTAELMVATAECEGQTKTTLRSHLPGRACQSRDRDTQATLSTSAAAQVRWSDAEASTQIGPKPA